MQAYNNPHLAQLNFAEVNIGRLHCIWRRGGHHLLLLAYFAAAAVPFQY